MGLLDLCMCVCECAYAGMCVPTTEQKAPVLRAALMPAGERERESESVCV